MVTKEFDAYNVTLTYVGSGTRHGGDKYVGGGSYAVQRSGCQATGSA
jgi:hypothetical protein